MHLPLEPDSKPRGQFGHEPPGVNEVSIDVVGVVGVVVVVVVAILIVVVIGEVCDCGIGMRGMRSQR